MSDREADARFGSARIGHPRRTRGQAVVGTHGSQIAKAPPTPPLSQKSLSQKEFVRPCLKKSRWIIAIAPSGMSPAFPCPLPAAAATTPHDSEPVHSPSPSRARCRPGCPSGARAARVPAPSCARALCAPTGDLASYHPMPTPRVARSWLSNQRVAAPVDGSTLETTKHERARQAVRHHRLGASARPDHYEHVISGSRARSTRSPPAHTRRTRRPAHASRTRASPVPASPSAPP